MQLFDLVLNYFHASDYIFIMTPWESLLQSNNGSSIIKQLALTAFFILEYIYIYIYIYIYTYYIYIYIYVYMYIFICIYNIDIYVYIYNMYYILYIYHIYYIYL